MEYHEYIYDKRFVFEAGGVLPSVKIAFHTSPVPDGTDWKTAINGRKIIWICHALTANSDAEDWWPGLVGSGKVLDPEKYFIVCVNMLGSCYGSSGPSQPMEDLRDNYVTRPYLLDFPAVTVRDMVRANIIVRKHLGIEKVDFLLGSSIGGFQAVEWLVAEPEVIDKALLMATSARVTPWITAWDEAQRMALEADPTFHHPEGDLLKGGQAGLMAARAVALLSYRSYDGYNSTQADEDDDTLFSQRAASYERYQGRKLAARFDAYSYYSLLRSVDSHNVGRGRRGMKQALAQIRASVTAVGINSDSCFPPEEVREMAEAIPDADYIEITSAFGHDGFLLENGQIGAIISGILEPTTHTSL